jgi:hypothetical protein
MEALDVPSSPPPVCPSDKATPSGAPPARHNAPPFLSGRPAFLPRRPSPSLTRNLLVVHGRRLVLVSRAPPSPTDVLRISPSSSSTSPFKEFTRAASNRRHRRGYLVGNGALRQPNSSPPVCLGPIQHHRRVPGELPVLLDPSPFLFPRRSARHGWPLPASGSQSGWAIAPADQVNLASQRGHGPPGQWPWVKLTSGVKSFCAFIYFRKIAASI